MLSAFFRLLQQTLNRNALHRMEFFLGRMASSQPLLESEEHSSFIFLSPGPRERVFGFTKGLDISSPTWTTVGQRTGVRCTFVWYVWRGRTGPIWPASSCSAHLRRLSACFWPFP